MMERTTRDVLVDLCELILGHEDEYPVGALDALTAAIETIDRADAGFVRRVLVRQGPSGAWYYIALGGNNEILSTAETFSDKEGAEESAGKLAAQLGVPMEVEQYE